jgi:hypothetical protein
VGLERPRVREGAGIVYQKDGGSETVYLNTPQGVRNVGRIFTENGERILEKHVTESKHLHRAFNAWGIDAELLRTLPGRGVDGIRIVTDTGVTEHAPVKVWMERGIRRDFGHGPQVFLPRKFFHRRDAAQPSLFGGEL